MKVSIVDNGGANLSSVRFALSRLGFESDVSSNPKELEKADKLILPGVGHAKAAMQNLRSTGLDTFLRETEQDLLGICLGMQLLFDFSQEGNVECLGILPGEVRAFEANENYRIPHMGWNQLEYEKDDHPLLSGIFRGDWVYFVHSYYLPVQKETLVSSSYCNPLTAIAGSGNKWGCQFHPERSGAVGATILKNFLRANFKES